MVGDVWLSSLNAARRKNYETLNERGFSMSVLVLWGKNDRAAPLDNGFGCYDLICAQTVQVDLHVINLSGHCSFRDQSETFNSVATAFFQRADGDRVQSARVRRYSPYSVGGS